MNRVLVLGQFQIGHQYAGLIWYLIFNKVICSLREQGLEKMRLNDDGCFPILESVLSLSFLFNRTRSRGNNLSVI
jgi:hypothetical protein